MDFSSLQRIGKARPYLTVFIVFAVSVVLLYGNTLSNGFVLDDRPVIQDNPYIQSLVYLPKVITGCMWEFAHGQCLGRTNYYRPTQGLSYLVTYQISSYPAVFHFINISYFLSVAFLIFVFARKLKDDFVFAFVAAFLFLIHPANSEAVNWISGIPDPLFGIFVLLSAIFYIDWRRSASSAQAPFKKYKGIALALIFYFLALLSKEPAILLPLILLFLDVAFLRLKPKEMLSFKHLWVYGAFAFLAATYIAIRIAVIGGISKGGFGYHGPFTIAERIHSSVTLFGSYMFKEVALHTSQFYHPFSKSGNLLDPAFLASLFLLLFLLVGSIILFRKKKRMYLFSFLWFLLFLSPVLVFFNALGDSVFSERYLFVPLIGFALGVGYTFSLVWNKKFQNSRDKKLVRKGLVGLLILLSLASVIITWQRNNDWKDNETFFRKSLEQTPDAYSLRYNFSFVLREKGDIEASRIELETLEAQNPSISDKVWDGLILVYLSLGDYHLNIQSDAARAQQYYTKSVAVAEELGGDSRGAIAYSRLGDLLAVSEEYLRAVPYFCRAAQISPDPTEGQQYLDRIISAVRGKYQDDLSVLYSAMIDEGIFQKNSSQAVRFVQKTCDEEHCLFFFSLQPTESQAVLPSLIVAADASGNVVIIQNSAYDPATSEAVLQVPLSLENSDLTFIFPTCSGTYYEATATENRE